MYLAAEGAQAIGPARGGDDLAAGHGEVEAEVAAEAGGGAGDEHHLPLQSPPRPPPGHGVAHDPTDRTSLGLSPFRSQNEDPSFEFTQQENCFT